MMAAVADARISYVTRPHILIPFSLKVILHRFAPGLVSPTTFYRKKTCVSKV